MRWILTMLALVAATMVGCETMNAGRTTRGATDGGAGRTSRGAERGGAPSAPSSDAIRKALVHPDRPARDLFRDGDRKPGQVLTFFRVEPGMTIADLMAGGGFYTELLSRVVGEEGRVYAQNNRIALERFADKQITERLADDRLPNVIRLDAELEALGLPDGELDRVFLVLFYHDTYWMEVDRAKMLEQIMKALKPGGYFCLIDHHAEAGSGARDVKTLHRVDAALVKKEVLAAGFKLDAESDLLRNGDDDHTLSVFDESIRGKTDRFIYRFRKPR